jgi:hypothetical protein
MPIDLQERRLEDAKFTITSGPMLSSSFVNNRRTSWYRIC